MTRVRLGLIIACALLAYPHAQTNNIASRLERAIRAAGVPVISVSIGDTSMKATWHVQPASLEAQARPIINAFDPTDPALDQQDLKDQATAFLDDERLTSAVVWTILKQMYPMDTDAQTKTKYGVARQRVIDAYRLSPWRP